MAVFPEGNPGEFPMDPTTPVGKFRALVGDTSSEPYDPPEEGFQNYTSLSDAEIEALIAQGGDSVPRGIGFYYLRLASEAATKSKVVKDYDLSVDLTKREAGLRAVAQVWFGQADGDDSASAEDAFEIVPVGRRSQTCRPEAAAYPFVVL